MPSFDNFKVFITEDRGDSRAKCVFPEKLLAKQSYRTLEFRDVSSQKVEEDFERIHTLAAEARTEFDNELARRVADAEARGRELGLHEAGEAHREELARLVERMEGAIQALHFAVDKAEEGATRDALRLGLMVAERLARISLCSNPAALSANLASAAEELEGDADLKVLAGPDLAAELLERTQSVCADLGVAALEVEADENLQPGDLIIYRGSAALDARVATRLRRLESQLLEELGLAPCAKEGPE